MRRNSHLSESGKVEYSLTDYCCFKDTKHEESDEGVKTIIIENKKKNTEELEDKKRSNYMFFI